MSEVPHWIDYYNQFKTLAAKVARGDYNISDLDHLLHLAEKMTQCPEDSHICTSI